MQYESCGALIASGDFSDVYDHKTDHDKVVVIGGIRDDYFKAMVYEFYSLLHDVQWFHHQQVMIVSRLLTYNDLGPHRREIDLMFDLVHKLEQKYIFEDDPDYWVMLDIATSPLFPPHIQKWAGMCISSPLGKWDIVDNNRHNWLYDPTSDRVLPIDVFSMSID